VHVFNFNSHLEKSNQGDVVFFVIVGKQTEIKFNSWL